MNKKYNEINGTFNESCKKAMLRVFCHQQSVIDLCTSLYGDE